MKLGQNARSKVDEYIYIISVINADELSSAIANDTVLNLELYTHRRLSDTLLQSKLTVMQRRWVLVKRRVQCQPGKRKPGLTGDRCTNVRMHSNN